MIITGTGQPAVVLSLDHAPHPQQDPSLGYSLYFSLSQYRPRVGFCAPNKAVGDDKVASGHLLAYEPTCLYIDVMELVTWIH